MRIEAKQLRGERKVKLHEAVPLAGPWSMWLDVTNLCNFRCIYCPTGNADMLATVNRGTGSMSLDLIDKIIRDLHEMPQLKIIGFYKDGEPLVHPHYTEIVRRFKEAGVSEQLWVKTNGELLDRHKDLATCGLDMVGVERAARARGRHLPHGWQASGLREIR
jgi:Molybdenum cofactor biosynthesis enzyme